MLNYKSLTQAMGNLKEDEVLAMLKDFIKGNPTEAEVQEALKACQDGMIIVGNLFEKGDYYIGDLMYAGELLNKVVSQVKPIIGSKSGKTAGKIVLGTVHDDLHDIGKNIFKNMAETAGFEVFDLGIDVPVAAFVEKVKEVKPDIVGMSGVLTMAINSMKDTVDGLKKAGLRDKVKITIGGACASQEAMAVSGADAWSTNAAGGVKVCLDWVKK